MFCQFDTGRCQQSVTLCGTAKVILCVKACEESAVICTFRYVLHIVYMERELIEHVRCRPLLHDPPIRNIGIKMFGRKHGTKLENKIEISSQYITSFFFLENYN
jgi:hypothetical protein